MSTHDDPVRTGPGARGADGTSTAAHRPGPTRHRRSTETKAAVKTTELIAYIVASVLVLGAALILDESDAGGFGARQAWLYFTILTVGYMISRGLAKSGSRDPYWDEDDNPRNGR
jgi:hypothetical protein